MNWAYSSINATILCLGNYLDTVTGYAEYLRDVSASPNLKPHVFQPEFNPFMSVHSLIRVTCNICYNVQSALRFPKAQPLYSIFEQSCTGFANKHKHRAN